MKKLAILFSLLIFCSSVAYSLNQNNKYKLKGVFKTPDSSVIPALRIYVNKNGEKSSVFTDINGEFEIELAPGNYELTVSKEISETFKAFIKIEENGLNPDFVEFTIEPKDYTQDFPKIIKSVTPVYPSQARAVRAIGEVVVEVKIDKEGKVTSAKVERGHPLLKSISETTAKQFLFESSEKSDERIAKITFIFLPYAEEKQNVKRFSDLYRIVINAKYPQIMMTSSG